MRIVSFLVALAAFHIQCASAQSVASRYIVTDLGGLGLGDLVVAWSVNTIGEVAGARVASSGDERSFVFRDNVLTTLGSVPTGTSNSSAYGVNDAGNVVGVYTTPGGSRHGYLHTSGVQTDIHPLVTLGGSSSFAAGINNFGQIIGAATVNPGSSLAGRHAFVVRNGKLMDLHPTVTFGGTWSEALGANDLGLIVGASQTADDDCYHAFSFGGGDNSVVDLHSLVQAGGCSSRASGVNGKGEIVGSAASASGGFRAFLYANAVATDLNILIPPDSGWILEFANGISDEGQIVGLGRYMGHPRAFLLTPVAASSAPESRVFAVSEILKAQDLYLGQRITVRGRLQISALHSNLSCPLDMPDCNPIIAVRVFLQDLEDSSKKVPVYRNGTRYECSYDDRGNYDCPPFTNNTVIVLEGVFSKGKEPDFVIGSSSPSGNASPPQVVKFRDFYYLDVGTTIHGCQLPNIRSTESCPKQTVKHLNAATRAQTPF